MTKGSADEVACRAGEGRRAGDGVKLKMEAVSDEVEREHRGGKKGVSIAKAQEVSLEDLLARSTKTTGETETI